MGLFGGVVCPSLGSTGKYLPALMMFTGWMRLAAIGYHGNGSIGEGTGGRTIEQRKDFGSWCCAVFGIMGRAELRGLRTNFWWCVWLLLGDSMYIRIMDVVLRVICRGGYIIQRVEVFLFMWEVYSLNPIMCSLFTRTLTIRLASVATEPRCIKCTCLDFTGSQPLPSPPRMVNFMTLKSRWHCESSRGLATGRSKGGGSMSSGGTETAQITGRPADQPELLLFCMYPLGRDVYMYVYCK